MQQLTLEIKSSDNYKIEDYIISNSNNHAYQHIVNSKEMWGVSPYNNFLLLCGARSSGKTHLATIWRKKAEANFLNIDQIELSTNSNQAIIIDNIENIQDEEKFLHFFNQRIISQYKTLLTINEDLQRFALRDLDSRIKSINKVSINPPDEELIKMIIIKLFSDRSIKITNAMLSYIIYRIDRSYESIHRFVHQVDEYSLILQKAITIPLLSKIIDQIDL